MRRDGADRSTEGGAAGEPPTGAGRPRGTGADARGESRIGQWLVEWLEGARLARDEAASRLLAALYNVALHWAQHRMRKLPEGADDAFDVAQEVAIRISLRLDQCRAKTDREIIGWTIAIARRTVADLLRAPSARHERLLRASMEVESVETVATPYWSQTEEHAAGADDDDSPAGDSLLDAVEGLSRSAVGRTLVLRATCSAYETLPEVTRHILHARLTESQHWQRIGDEVGITAAAAKRRCQRAQVRLRRRILDLVAELPDEQRTTAANVLLSWGVSLPDASRAGQAPPVSGAASDRSRRADAKPTADSHGPVP